VRSSRAVSVSVHNAQREIVVNHVPTISDPGYNGNAFNTHVPHTVRQRETKGCSDCHVSAKGDNNAWVASTLMLGSNQVNFMGRYIYVAEGKSGLSATLVAEETEPQAVFGSHQQSIVYPNNFAQHLKRGLKLTESHAHRSNESNQVQMYGEFLLSAAGHNGFIVYDIANIANKGFNQRIVTAPFSPIGQRLYVRTKDATGVAVGSPAPLDPKRKQLPVNEELPVAPLFGYAFISDRVEGLITVDITTLTDGVPTNDHLKRAATYNPDGKLSGARKLIIVGNYAYVLTDRALAVVRISDPTRPELIREVGAPALRDPRFMAVQFRYAFITDAEGLKVLNVTDLEHPRPIAAGVPLRNARGVYLARTFAYVAAGQDGLAIVDVERPEQPRLVQLFNADGKLNDAYDVKVGMIYAGLFAYVADGRNGLKVVQLTSPQSVPGNLGFSPQPAPNLIAYYPTRGTAIQVSEGYRRDRGVDESGNQIAIFGRRGARPFNYEEMRRMYLIDGQLFTVTDEPNQTGAASARLRE
jgi:LVIVD repeat-containing protein